MAPCKDADRQARRAARIASADVLERDIDQAINA